MTNLIVGFCVGAFVVALIAWFGLRRQLGRAIESERRAREAERMAEIGAMTGGLAHEIKNPLSTIGLNAQLLAELIEDAALADDERRRMLNRIGALRREVERLAGILSDFLEFAGQPHLDLVEAEMNELVSDLVDFYTPEAERRGVRLRADSAPEPVRGRLDIRRVKQAIINLMLNATQAMEAAGPQGDRPSELILRTRSGTGRSGEAVLRVEINDTGPGIPPEKLAEIFRPYYSTRSGGSGLGLPTARRLIEAHGGEIEVHSEVGRGTSFTVILPVTGTVNDQRSGD